MGDVERRYRTVLDAPDNDDNLKELQKIGEKIIDLQTSEPAAVIRQKKILMLLEKGYDVSQISQRIGITKRHVQRILKENNLTPKPNFVYKITNKNGTANRRTTGITGRNTNITGRTGRSHSGNDVWG